jgi:hypothetical protein
VYGDHADRVHPQFSHRLSLERLTQTTDFEQGHGNAAGGVWGSS